MELMYVKAMNEYGLQFENLPEDAQSGIEQINGVITGMKLLEKRGKTIPEKTFKKLKAIDKWVYYEILDMVNETDQNDDEMPYSSDELMEDVNNEIEDENEGANDEGYGDNAIGSRIDTELEVVFKSGKKTLTLDEIKKMSKSAYAVIFDNYEENERNGIETSNFSLLETENEYVFNLTKK
jgi:hypothetical protein